jgi:hypothetical protein
MQLYAEPRCVAKVPEADCCDEEVFKWNLGRHSDVKTHTE